MGVLCSFRCTKRSQGHINGFQSVLGGLRDAPGLQEVSGQFLGASETLLRVSKCSRRLQGPQGMLQGTSWMLQGVPGGIMRSQGRSCGAQGRLRAISGSFRGYLEIPGVF